ncbi:MAG: CDP-glycerol glycerophosphotransferase family protein [Roseburia sp.]|nr:CDP-glycerol glycerophosphotransferase family protein [Roseburia sp.]MCM1278126.1 CDP-glycerol glycerophosphotransferase family protein [Robinsoniella sp.]
MNDTSLKRKEIEELFQSDSAAGLSKEKAAGLVEEMSLQEIYSLKLPAEQKYLLGSLKCKTDILKEASVEKTSLVYQGQKVYNFSSGSLLKLFFMEEQEGGLLLKGLMKVLLSEEFSVFFEDQNGTAYPLCLGYEEPAGQRFLGEELKSEQWFTVKIHYEDSKELKLKAFLQFRENQKILLNPSYKLFFPVTNSLKSNYGVWKNTLLQVKGKTLVLTPYTKRLHRELERKYRKELLGQKEFEVLRYRIAYWLLKPFVKKEIWLILDRAARADDNGEHFFKYLMNHYPKGKKMYYVIEKSCPDYKRMKAVGKVLPLGSFWHKLCFLLSGKIISSQFDPYVFKPFKEKGHLVQDLFAYQSVFLQHGVTQNDLSRFLGRKTKDFKLLVAVSEKEKQSFLQNCYGYTEKEVKVTGFPRFDYLKQHENEQTRKILIMPSWRKSIQGSYDVDTGASIYFDGFKNTSYFQFYNSLINDKRLLACMKEHDYKGVFALHPGHYKQYVDFEQNGSFTILGEEFSYQEQFISCALMVTDYSSVAFDFAYLKKPVIYARFDEEQFYAGQKYGHGYFDFEKDGFGPVCKDLDATVNELIHYIENGCALEEKYAEHIHRFYQYQDADNCKRVLEAVLKL